VRGRHQHLATEVSTLLFRGKLVLKVNASGPRFNHRPGQLICVQRSTESGLGIGHNGHQPVAGYLALSTLNLVCPQQRLVQTLHHPGHTVHRIQTLIRIHLARAITIGRNLPAAEIDGLQTRPHLLHGLATTQCAQGIHIVLRMQQVPQLLSTLLSQAVLNAHGATQTANIL